MAPDPNFLRFFDEKVQPGIQANNNTTKNPFQLILSKMA
jgi:hypothetical protein